LPRTSRTWRRVHPIVVFTHSPLWDYYPRWNFQTSDAPEIREILSKFDNVMSYHGHVHQTLYNKIGNMSSVAAMSTSWPWPYPPVALAYPETQMNRADPSIATDGQGVQIIDLSGDFEGHGAVQAVRGLTDAVHAGRFQGLTAAADRIGSRARSPTAGAAPRRRRLRSTSVPTTPRASQRRNGKRRTRRQIPSSEESTMKTSTAVRRALGVGAVAADHRRRQRLRPRTLHRRRA
jgi:hypothetical protein